MKSHRFDKTSKLDSQNIIICLIVAASENWVIGRDGVMPWHLIEDLKYFKRVTMGKPIIMGRKTFDSIGKPLPGRCNIIVTRNKTFKPSGTIVCYSLDTAINAARGQALEEGISEIMIIGGGQIFTNAIKYADRVYLTEVHTTINGDIFSPEFSNNEWQEVSRELISPKSSDQPPFSFVVLERR